MENDIITYMREMTRFERLLWKLYVFFGYHVYKSMFGDFTAGEWKEYMLDCIEKVPKIIWT